MEPAPDSTAGRREATRHDWRERIVTVLRFVQEHLDEDLGVERLARVAHASPYHFHRMFRGLVGEPLAAHVRRLRLERAAHRLKQGQDSILELALEAGYESHEAFTRAFARAFDQPPSVFRQGGATTRLGSPTQTHYRPPGEAGPTFEAMTTSDLTIELRDLPLTRVAYLRHTGPYEQCGATWEALCAQAGRAGLFGPDARMLGASHDDPEAVAPADLRYDACLVVPEGRDVPAPLEVQELGGGRYAVAVHAGPYEQLARTYGELFAAHFGATGTEPGEGPCLEFYLNDPGSTAPADLRTEIWVPLAD